MPIINKEGQPLPDNHPLKGTSIIIGVKPPPGYEKKSKNGEQTESLNQTETYYTIATNYMTKNEWDEDYFNELAQDKIFELSKIVLSVGWSGDAPGDGGAMWINEWEDIFWITSSDFGPIGPFADLEEALSDEYFNVGLNRPDLSSDCVSEELLIKIALGMVCENEGECFINGERYFYTHKDRSLRKSE